MFKKFKKSNLDEMQEQKLREIESHGCWLAFWGLLAAIVTQEVVYGYEFSHIAGEWIVFMALALYLSFGCAKNGIWSRSLRADRRTNVVVSLTAGAAVAAVIFGTSFARYRSLGGSAAAGLIGGVCAFLACWAAVSLMARYTKKRQAELEKEPENEEE